LSVRLAVSLQENETAVMTNGYQKKTKTESRKPHWWVYLKQCAAYLWRGICALWPLWVCIFAVAAFWKFLAFFGCVEKDFRLLGMLLQLVGVLTVAKVLIDSGRLFKKPTFRERIAQYFKRFPRRHVPIHGSLSAQEEGHDIARVRVFVSPSPDTPLEKRVEMLEEKTKNLFSEVDELGEKIRAQSDGLALKITEEVTQRKAGQRAFEEQLESAIIGGSHVEWWGVIFFIVGIILASTSPELAGWLQSSGNCG
jgi:uncharacterized protein (TIGR04206 family)